MNKLQHLILLSTIAFLPLAACNNGSDASPLSSAGPSINNIPGDDGQIFRGGSDYGGSPNSGGNDLGSGATHTSTGVTGTHKADTGNVGTNQNPPVPEPATMLVFGSGLAGLALARRRRKEGVEVESSEE